MILLKTVTTFMVCLASQTLSLVIILLTKLLTLTMYTTCVCYTSRKQYFYRDAQ